MAKMIRIIVGDDIIVSSDTRAITTTFYIEVNGTYFPNNQWTDFVESVLGMWIEGLIKNSRKKNIKFTLYFMDGPYRIDVLKHNNQLTINCINSRKDETSELSFACSYFDFLSAICSALESFNDILNSRGVHEERFSTTYKQNLDSIKRIKNILEDIKDDSETIGNT